MINISTKNRFLTIVAIAFACSTSALSAAQLPKWVSINKKTMQHWNVKQQTGNIVQLQANFKTKIKSPKKVFVLFPKKSSAYNTAITKVLNHFHEHKINALFTLYNYGGKKPQGHVALRYMLQQKTDLMLTMGSKSTAFAFKNYLRGKVPVVSICSKDPVLLGQMKNYTKGSGNNFAFTSLNVPVTLQLSYLKQLKPKLRVLAILYAQKNISAVKTQFLPLKKLAQQKGIRVIGIAVQNQKNAEAELRGLIPATIARIRRNDPTLRNTLFWITGSTSVFREIKTINHYASIIPVLSAVPNVVKKGNDSAAISIGVGFENNAQLAAIYAVSILLNKVKPGALRVGVVSPPDIAINFKLVKKINLKIPFSFLESASFIYNYQGVMVRDRGRNVVIKDRKKR